jgi:hypothetical protein
MGGIGIHGQKTQSSGYCESSSYFFRVLKISHNTKSNHMLNILDWKKTEIDSKENPDGDSPIPCIVAENAVAEEKGCHDRELVQR